MNKLEKEIKELTHLKELIESSQHKSSETKSSKNLSLTAGICVRKCDNCVTACDTACTTRCDTSKYLDGE